MLKRFLSMVDVRERGEEAAERPMEEEDAAFRPITPKAVPKASTCPWPSQRTHPEHDSPFTSVMGFVRQGLAIARDPKHTAWICPLLLIADATLCPLIVWRIPYTEIDWKAYMQQIATYLSGERDYVKIRGDTGPLVYPAAHVYIYRLLYAATEDGRNVKLAQYIFIALYLATLTLVMLCYRNAKAPPYMFPLLILSKRLHSIFLLRLFNDGFAVFFLFLAIYCYQKRMWTLGSIAYSVGLSVKMSLLLALPAVGVVLWQGMGRDRALKQALLMGQIQILLGYPFIAANAQSYASRAFEFSRQFLFKWTVNWRFVGEENFQARWFSVSLLVLHAALLLAFLSSKWLHTSLSNAVKDLFSPPSARYQAEVARGVTPSFILTTILSSVIIGCLCARSLHYQFYAYIFWSTPFLLWRSGLHPVLIFGTWAAQEWAWNVYPSTDTSSMTVIECLMVQVLAVWLGRTNESLASGEEGKKEHDE